MCSVPVNVSSAESVSMTLHFSLITLLMPSVESNNAQYLQVFFTDFRIVVVLIIQISKYIFTKVLRTLITFFLKEIIEKNK